MIVSYERQTNMKNGAHVHILHNPTAGEQDNTKTELIELMRPLGIACDYASVKEKGWHRFKSRTDLLVIVGGDGTIRAVAEKILKRKLLDRRLPLLLLPSGTANNFAITLGISHDPKDLPDRIRQSDIRTIDVGTINGVSKTSFFLEGMGFGLFPKLMEAMKRADLSIDTRNEELQTAIDKLIEITEDYKAASAKVIIDGTPYTGKFLLINVLNTQSIGPNLCLAPHADPGDGILHVAMLREENREHFLAYLKNRQTKKPNNRPINNLPWELVELHAELLIKSKSDLLHVDDELLAIKKKKLVRVNIRKGVLDIVL